MITSPQNETVKRIVRLRKDGSYRLEERRYLLEGLRQVETALEEVPRAVNTLIVCGNLLGKRADEFREKARSINLEILEVSKDVFKKLAGTRTPQGLAAIMSIHASTAENLWKDPAARMLLVLDGIQDPGNAGALVRSASAFDFPGVLFLEDSADPYNAKTVRSSAGAIAGVPCVKIKTKQLIEIIDGERRAGGNSHEKTGRAIIATSPHRGVALEDWTPPEFFAIVIGGESLGVRPALAERADEWLQIRASAKIESLNAAVAGSLVLYHAFRRGGL